MRNKRLRAMVAGAAMLAATGLGTGCATLSQSGIHNEGHVVWRSYTNNTHFGEIEVAAGHPNIMAFADVSTFMDEGFSTNHGPEFHPDRVAYTVGALARWKEFDLRLGHVCNHKVDANGMVFQGEFVQVGYYWGGNR